MALEVPVLGEVLQHVEARLRLVHWDLQIRPSGALGEPCPPVINSCACDRSARTSSAVRMCPVGVCSQACTLKRVLSTMHVNVHVHVHDVCLQHAAPFFATH